MEFLIGATTILLCFLAPVSHDMHGRGGSLDCVAETYANNSCHLLLFAVEDDEESASSNDFSRLSSNRTRPWFHVPSLIHVVVFVAQGLGRDTFAYNPRQYLRVLRSGFENPIAQVRTIVFQTCHRLWASSLCWNSRANLCRYHPSHIHKTFRFHIHLVFFVCMSMVAWTVAKCG